MVVGKRLIGQITLIKGNNVSRFHGRITMPQASQVHLNISLMPPVWSTGRTCARFFVRINARGSVRSSSVVRKGRPSKLFQNAVSLPRETAGVSAVNSFCHPDQLFVHTLPRRIYRSSLTHFYRLLCIRYHFVRSSLYRSSNVTLL